LGIAFAIGYAVGARSPAKHDAPTQGSSTGSEPVEAPAHGELILSDFETSSELGDRWKTRDVTAEQSPEHAAHGRYAAKVTFSRGEAPSFSMEHYLEGHRQRSNWRRFRTFSFNVYNAESSQQRLILQIKDGHDRRYKEDIFINGKSSQLISVRLEDLKEYLDLSHIVQIALFRWQPKSVATFYVDAFRLQPGHQAAAASPAPRPQGQPEGADITPKHTWQVAWASGLIKLFRDPAKFQGHASNPVQMSLARGEYESIQLALIGGPQPARVKVSVGPLTHTDGSASFPPGVIEVRRVDYVTTKPPAYPVTFVGDWPDPLPLANEIEVPVGAVQPVWITVGAPEQLPSGQYNGTITVTDTQGRTEQLAMQVVVWDFALPRTAHLTTAFDFYRFRLRKAYQEFVPGGAAWEGRLERLEQLYYLDMLKHRISPVIGADPSSPQFARAIGRYLNLGLGAFGVGTMGGSNGNNWPRNPAELEKVMGWYRTAAAALRSQGLLDKAYIYAYDEPTPGDPHVAQVMEYLHWADPDLKNLLVMHQAPDPVRDAQWLKEADILCLRIAAYDPEQAPLFKQLGKELWIYVSSPAPPFAGLVIDYPAISHRILSWLCWKYGATGLLYWCVNFWTGDPWTNPANFSEDQNGSGLLYYPTAEGPVPSLRMEVLRDGIEDYEYLYRLQELIEAAKRHGGVDASLLAQAEQLVAVDPNLIESMRSYSKDPAVLLAQRQAIAEMIVKLQALGSGT